MAENKAGAETETAEKDERMASDANPDIRVLLCSDNYASEYHDRITITADVPFRVSGQGTERHYQAGEQVELTMQSNEFLQGDLVFTMEEDGCISASVSETCRRVSLLRRESSCGRKERKV